MRNARLRIFISYSRKDSSIADALVVALEERGFTVTIDRRDLEFGEKWQHELSEFIRLSDTVIWLVSEYSIKSEWVNWELDEVARRSKRLVPVLIGSTPRDRLPRQLGEIHILPAIGLFTFQTHLETLIRILETDRDWLKEGSRLADRAIEWLTKGRPSALLLRGPALAQAERWTGKRQPKAPAPSQDVLEFILTSRQTATKGQRFWVAGSSVVAVAAIALSGFIYIQNIEVNRQRAEAVSQRQQAEKSELAANNARQLAQKSEQEARQQLDQTLIAQSFFLADRANEKVSSGDAVTAALLSAEALPDNSAKLKRPYVASAEKALDKSKRLVSERTVFGGHEHLVWRSTFSQDGAKVLTSSFDNSARLWATEGGTELVKLRHNDIIFGAALSSDGAKIVTASRDKLAKVWRASTGEVISTLAGHCAGNFEKTSALGGCAVTEAVFNFDATLVATASNDSTARIWDALTGSELALISHEGSVTSVSFSRDGSSILTSSYDGVAKITSVTSKQESVRFVGHSEAVWMATFSPDEKLIATVSGDNTARIWDAKTGKELHKFAHDDNIWSVVFSRDGKTILTGSDDKTARIWNIETGIEVQKFSHDASVLKADFALGGAAVVTALSNNELFVWIAGSDKLLNHFSHFGAINDMAISPDGTTALTASHDRTARIWSIINPELIPEFKHESGVDEVQFAGDGQRFVTASIDGVIRVWDAQSQSPLLKIDSFKLASSGALNYGGNDLVVEKDNSVYVFNVNTGKVRLEIPNENSPTLSPNGQRLITVSAKAEVVVRSAADWGVVYRSASYAKPPGGFAFSSDGKRVAGFAKDKVLRVWNVEGFKEMSSHQFNGDVYNIGLSPDGKLAVAIVDFKIMSVIDASTGGERFSGQIAETVINDLAFTPDSRNVVTASGDGYAEVWDLMDGTKIFQLKHGGPVQSVAFSLDGKRIATGSSDEVARIWDALAGSEAGRLTHQGEVFKVGFSPDNKWVFTAAGGGDAKVRLWDIGSSLETRLGLLKERVGRCLTRAQRLEFHLSDEPPEWCIEKRRWPYGSEAWFEWLKAIKASKKGLVPRDEYEAPNDWDSVTQERHNHLIASQVLKKNRKEK